MLHISEIAKNTGTKLCKNCAYYLVETNSTSLLPKCTKFGENKYIISHHYTISKFPLAYLVRTNVSLCGPEGKHYKKKP
jgi:hypothetical protein